MTRVEAVGPYLPAVGDEPRRRAVLVRVFERLRVGRRTVCYGVATTVSCADRPDAMINMRGFGATQRTLAWRAFADRVLDLTLELEAREHPDVTGARPSPGTGDGHPRDRETDR